MRAARASTSPRWSCTSGASETLTLTTAYITSFQTGGNGLDHVVETLQFVAAKITTQYTGATKSGPLPALKYDAKTQLKL